LYLVGTEWALWCHSTCIAQGLPCEVAEVLQSLSVELHEVGIAKDIPDLRANFFVGIAEYSLVVAFYDAIYSAAVNVVIARDEKKAFGRSELCGFS